MDVITAAYKAVALRKESVDRNMTIESSKEAGSASLSARRAWIEMRACWYVELLADVALRKESVDRNTSTEPKKQSKGVSLSARRAWIEIFIPFYYSYSGCSRSPQGERG